MTLQELWNKAVAGLGDQDKVIASAYAASIAELSDDLGDLYEPQEYPKWVGLRLVHTAEEEAELAAPGAAPTGAPEAPIDSEPETTPADTPPAESPEGGVQ